MELLSIVSDSERQHRSRNGEKWKRLVYGDKPSSTSLNAEAAAVTDVITKGCHIKACVVIARRINPNPKDTKHRWVYELLKLEQNA